MLTFKSNNVKIFENKAMLKVRSIHGYGIWKDASYYKNKLWG